MAFKPFDYFRKRQKLILAALAILSMFLFIIGDVLTGRRAGGGGLGGRLGRLFGKSNDIAVVEGQTLDAEQLELLARQRLAALRFASEIEYRGTNAAMELANISVEDRNRLISLIQQRGFQLRSLDPRMLGLYVQILSQGPLPEQQKKWLNELREKLSSSALADAMGAQSSALSNPSRLGQNPPFYTSEGLVEFVLWQKKADELGIVMSPSKIAEDLVKLGAKSVSEDEFPRLAARQKFASDTLLRTLGDELKVMIARGVILGTTPTAAKSLVNEPTPADLWDAYTKIKTELEVAILPVPVNSKEFLAKVPDPTADELTKYYNDYKNQEPDPARETPGFRIPRKYQIRFLYGDLKSQTNDTSKFYDTWMKVSDILPVVLNRSLTDFLMPPRMLIEAASNFQMTRQFRYTDQQPYVLVPAGAKPEEAVYYRAPIPTGTEAWPTSATIERQRIEQIAQVAGIALGLPLPVSPLASLTTLAKNRIEKAPRVQALGAEVTSLVANAGQGLPGLLAFPPHLASIVTYRNFADVQSGIVDEITEQRRMALMQSDLAQLKSNLEEYAKTDEFRQKHMKWRENVRNQGASGTPPPFEPPPMHSDEYWKKYKEWKVAEAEAKLRKKEPPKFEPPADEKDKTVPIQECLDRYAKARGMVLAGMKEPRSRLDLFKESGDTPLGTLLKPVFFSARYDESRIIDDLTAPKALYEPGEVQAPQAREFALYWRTLETDARTPPFAEVEPKVREAWKLEKARAEAEKAAQAIASDKEIQGKPDGYRKLLDIDNKQFGNSYTERRVVRYDLDDRSRMSGIINYTRAKPPSAFEHPPDDLIDRVLDGLQKQGDTLVVANKPKSHYYVLFLLKRTEPRAKDEIWIRQFDQEVIYPAATKQMEVDNQPITQWVARNQSQQFNKDWGNYVKSSTKFNAENAKKLTGALEHLLQNRYGGGEEF
jgi:hypothetical protein